MNFERSSITPSAFNESDPNMPKPESTVQYYRASSVALVLQGYNNTAALSEDANQTQTALPSDVDSELLSCLNFTIGEAVPLIDGACPKFTTPTMGIFSLVWVVWCLSHVL